MELLIRNIADEKAWDVCAPGVGYVLQLPDLGQPLPAGAPCGSLQILGQRHPLTLPSNMQGSVSRLHLENKRLQPVSYGQPLFRLSQLHSQSKVEPAPAQETDLGVVLRAPQAGRFYRCPDPNSPPFVAVGEVVALGRTLGLMEVMKTFNPIKYGGGNLPERAVVRAILVEDHADVEEGTPLFAFEEGE